MSTTTDIVARLSGMSADHGPDGWPAVRMRDITALCEEVTRLRAELAEAQQLARDDFDLRAEQRDERDRLRAALAQAGAGRGPLSDDPWRKLYRRAINEAGGLTNYVEDRPELRSAERRISAIEAEARTLADSGTTSGTKGAA